MIPWSEFNRETERFRGKESEEVYQRRRHSAAGASMGMLGGACAGMAVCGSAVPVVGHVIGGIGGGFVGAMAGAKDQTSRDNVKTFLKNAVPLFGSLHPGGI